MQIDQTDPQVRRLLDAAAKSPCAICHHPQIAALSYLDIGGEATVAGLRVYGICQQCYSQANWPDLLVRAVTAAN